MVQLLTEDFHRQERTMMQVMEQINSLGGQIAEFGERVHGANQAFTRIYEHDGAIRYIYNELKEIKDEMRSLRTPIKRSSDTSQSPASRTHFASPRTVPSAHDHGPRPEHQRYSADGHIHRDHYTHSPAGSQPSDSAHNINHKVPHHGQMAKPMDAPRGHEKPDDEISKFDPLNGQLSIPLEHTTAAHKLLTSWAAIKPFHENILDKDYAAEYVMREEKARGLLRIYGQGEGFDGGHRYDSLVYGSFNGYKRPAAHPIPTDSNWGTGFETKVNFGPRTEEDCEGGLDMNGYLCLEGNVVKRLFHSFMSNIWILHPFLDKHHVANQVQMLINRHNSSTGFISSPIGADIKIETLSMASGHKRKRSSGSTAEFDNAKFRPGGMANVAIERSANNAVVLLTLALGKICEHKGPLPPPVGEDVISATFEPQSATSAASPAQHMRSPDSFATPKSVNTPILGHDKNAHRMSRTSSGDSQRLRNYPRNIDRIPGLAYYAMAVELLGDHTGSPSLTHVHACLLAGLYMGQLARVIDSWSWINRACTACQLLFKNEQYVNHEIQRSMTLLTVVRDLEKFRERGEHELANAITIAYWTGLQLER